MTDFNPIAATLRLPHQKLGEVIFLALRQLVLKNKFII